MVRRRTVILLLAKPGTDALLNEKMIAMDQRETQRPAAAVAKASQRENGATSDAPARSSPEADDAPTAADALESEPEGHSDVATADATPAPAPTDGDDPPAAAGAPPPGRDDEDEPAAEAEAPTAAEVAPAADAPVADAPAADDTPAADDMPVADDDPVVDVHDTADDISDTGGGGGMPGGAFGGGGDMGAFGNGPRDGGGGGIGAFGGGVGGGGMGGGMGGGGMGGGGMGGGGMGAGDMGGGGLGGGGRLTSTDGGRAYEWRALIPTSARDALTLVADCAGLSGTDAAINVTTRTKGEFALQFSTATDHAGRSTSYLVPHDASAAALEAALENLTSVGDVVVTRRRLSEYDSAGHKRNVTFTMFGAPTHAGTVELLTVAKCEFLQCTVLGKHGAVSDDVTLRGRGVIFF